MPDMPVIWDHTGVVALLLRRGRLGSPPGQGNSTP